VAVSKRSVSILWRIKPNFKVALAEDPTKLRSLSTHLSRRSLALMVMAVGRSHMRTEWRCAGFAEPGLQNRPRPGRQDDVRGRIRGEMGRKNNEMWLRGACIASVLMYDNIGLQGHLYRKCFSISEICRYACR